MSSAKLRLFHLGLNVLKENATSDLNLGKQWILKGEEIILKELNSFMF